MKMQDSFPTRILQQAGSVSSLVTHQPWLRSYPLLLLCQELSWAEKLTQEWELPTEGIRNLSDLLPELDPAQDNWFHSCADFSSTPTLPWLVIMGNRQMIQTGKWIAHRFTELTQHPGALPMIWIPTELEALEELSAGLQTRRDTGETSQRRHLLSARPQWLVLDSEYWSLPLNLEDFSLAFGSLSLALFSSLTPHFSSLATGLGLHTLRTLPELLLTVATQPSKMDDLQQMAGQIAHLHANTEFLNWPTTMAEVVEDRLQIPAFHVRSLLLRTWLEEAAEQQSHPQAGAVLEALGLLHLRPAAVGHSLLDRYPLEALLDRSPLGSPKELWAQFAPSNWQQICDVPKQRAQGLLRRLEPVDQWVQQQTLKVAAEQLEVLQRKLSYLTGIPLNLRQLGFPQDPEVIVHVALETRRRLQLTAAEIPDLIALQQTLSTLIQQDLEPWIVEDPLDS